MAVNGAGQEVDAAVLDELLREWKRRGADLRARLEATRERLVGQLAEVDQALADLPATGATIHAKAAGHARSSGHATPSVHDPWAEGLKGQDLTATDVILAVLARAQEWMTSLQVLEIARRVKPDLTPELLHSGLYRLVQSERIASKGNRGSKLYATKGLDDAASE